MNAKIVRALTDKIDASQKAIKEIEKYLNSVNSNNDVVKNESHINLQIVGAYTNNKHLITNIVRPENLVRIYKSLVPLLEDERDFYEGLLKAYFKDEKSADEICKIMGFQSYMKEE